MEGVRMEDDRILTADGAAEVLRVSRNQLYKLISAGKIHTTKVGQHVGIRVSDLPALG